MWMETINRVATADERGHKGRKMDSTDIFKRRRGHAVPAEMLSGGCFRHQVQLDESHECPFCVSEDTEKSKATPKQQLSFLIRDITPLVRAIKEGMEYDPGHSDLDNEQPVNIRITLGEYRRACRLLIELEKCS